MKKQLSIILIILVLGTAPHAQNPYIHHYTSQDGLPSNTVYYIFQDSKKFIWFATDNGVSRYDGTVFTNYGTKKGLDNNEVIRIKEDSFGRIWFFNLNGSLNFFFQNKVFNKANAPFLDSLKSPKFFRDFFEDDDKKIYFNNNRSALIAALDTGNHVRKFDLDMNIKVRWRVRPIMKMFARYISKDKDGKILLWSNFGIFNLENFCEKPRITLLTDTLRIDEVYPGKGNSNYMLLLLSSDSVLNWIPADKMALLKVTNEINGERIILPLKSDHKYTSVLEDIDGFLWVATFDKGVFCLKNNRVIRHYNIREAQSIIQDNENNIWISSMNEGVFKISPIMKFQKDSDNVFFRNEPITALCPNYPH